MIPCISVANMRESDRKTIETIVPGLTLMYRAAMGVYLAACWTDHTVIAVGGGNNGGDGFALACILQEHGHSCRVVTLSDHLSPDSAHFAEKAKQLGVPVSAYAPGAFSGCGTIVDCLLGTGFAGEVREPYSTAIREINSSGARVISVDIPSGMNGDTGEAVTAVRSDTTVTIGFVKRGLITEHAGNYMSHLICADIGIRLDREEDLICPAEEWSDAVAARGNVFPAPRWLNMRPIDVRDVSYKRMVIETKRLSIHTASRDEMLRYVEAQTDVILKSAYQEMLQGCLDHPDQWEWYSIWMIELKDGTHVGDLSFKGFNADGSVEIGYGIKGEHQGQGYAAEAVNAAVMWALQQPDITRVEAETEPDNSASQRVLEKCGFAPSGIIGEEGPRFIRTL